MVPQAFNSFTEIITVMQYTERNVETFSNVYEQHMHNNFDAISEPVNQISTARRMWGHHSSRRQSSFKFTQDKPDKLVKPNYDVMI